MTVPSKCQTWAVEANREAVRQAFDAWSAGTQPITDLFAPDMVWRVEGHSLASKEYKDKQQFIDEVLAPFGARFDPSNPFRPIAIRAVYADGDTVIVSIDNGGVCGNPAGCLPDGPARISADGSVVPITTR